MRARAVVAVAAALLALLALAAVPAGAVRVKDDPVYFVESTDPHVSEEWRSQDGGYPRRCANWVLAEGRSNLGAAQHRPRKLTLAPTFGGGAIGTVGGSRRRALRAAADGEIPSAPQTRRRGLQPLRPAERVRQVHRRPPRRRRQREVRAAARHRARDAVAELAES